MHTPSHARARSRSTLAATAVVHAPQHRSSCSFAPACRAQAVPQPRVALPPSADNVIREGRPGQPAASRHGLACLAWPAAAVGEQHAPGGIGCPEGVKVGSKVLHLAGPAGLVTADQSPEGETAG